MINRVLLMRTGGTIDAAPYANPKQPPQFVSTLKSAQSLILKTVATLPVPVKVDNFAWKTDREEARFVKDSQLFTPQDADDLATIIRNDDHDSVIITHGTDAMTRNAQRLQERLAGTDKRVVFTGAMVPLSMDGGANSDGAASLRYSLENVGKQPPGVYVTGRDSATREQRLFNPQDVEKDREASAALSQFTLKPRASSDAAISKRL